ncbi:unnamed protein product [Schistocephalus solidus]|uniref:G_PROTEIN_RECEP_F1_2 domain-containing protein n=1 Tax=Schistocephalus solidus TaxID=70667 RepID=A0A183SSB6_SCHSO|nr:unnamed protein product [Schistocephalus solidus]
MSRVRPLGAAAPDVSYGWLMMANMPKTAISVSIVFVSNILLPIFLAVLRLLVEVKSKSQRTPGRTKAIPLSNTCGTILCDVSHGSSRPEMKCFYHVAQSSSPWHPGYPASRHRAFYLAQYEERYPPMDSCMSGLPENEHQTAQQSPR